ncbi:hypothetical protein Ndes2437B_g03934 [Nannochloris sp. 'desiccata']
MDPASGSWAVDLKFHTVSGLRQSDPNISIKVTSPDDEDHCKFSTATLPSLRGTAFLGAWTTVIIRGSNSLKISVEEHLSVVHILSPSRFKASSIINLKEYAADSDVEKCRQGFSEVVLVLVSNKRKKKQVKVEEAKEYEARIENNKARTLAAAEREAREAAIDGGGGGGAAAAPSTTPVPPYPINERRLSRSEASLINPQLLRLRLSLRVTPLAEWSEQRGSYHSGCGALELPIAPIPYQLHSYAHGGFMGLGCSIIEDHLWKGIFQSVDPHAWSAVQHALRLIKLRDGGHALRPSTAMSRLMTVLENSPVLSAFGIVRSGKIIPVVDISSVSSSLKENGSILSLSREVALSQTSRQLSLRNRMLSRKLSRRVVETAKKVGRAALLQAPTRQLMDPLLEDGLDVRLSSATKQEALANYRELMEHANEYGYKPLPIEWDVWVHPNRPSVLSGASIAHGSATALVTQAITTSIGFGACARQAGRSQISGREGLPPAEWLTQFGNSINIAVNGDKDTPLELHGPEGACWKLVAKVERIDGLNPEKWRKISVFGDIDSPDVVLTPQRTGDAFVKPDGTAIWAADGSNRASVNRGSGADPKLSFWPLPLDLLYDDVLFTASGEATVSSSQIIHAASDTLPSPLVTVANVAGAGLTIATKPLLSRRCLLGMARMNLNDIVTQHPGLLEGEELLLELDIGPKQARKTHLMRPRPSSSMQKRSHKKLAVKKDSKDTELGSIASEVSVTINPMIEEKQEMETLEEMVLLEELEEVEESAASPKSLKSPPAASATGHKTSARLVLRLSLEEVPVIEAAINLGVPRAAAQTAIAMLSQPGGLYLDIKSAYSTPYDLQLFVSSLKGIGISTKAVCSFKAEQLKMGPVADTVLFFHGLSGLENTCDSGAVPPGQFVLFNGASFLTDFKRENFEHMSQVVAETALAGVTGWPLDLAALRKYHAICEKYEIVGGIYVQEPDAAPAGVDALCRLVAEYPSYFPLGFCYGHVSGRAVTWLDAKGRGFATQQLVEEFAARKNLAGKAVSRIAKGEHRNASLATNVVLAGWLIRGGAWMGYFQQLAFCTLLADMQPDAAVAALVAEIGGIEFLCTRFHHFYELITPLTFLESGWNWDFTKSLLRLLRNRSVLARLTAEQKIDLANYFISVALYGYGLTYLAQIVGFRRGLHKHAKEGLCCLFESSTAFEVRKVLNALGGRAKVKSYLCGWSRLSWHYKQRLEDVERNHKRSGSDCLAYKNPDLKYAALPYTPSPFFRRRLTLEV